MAAIRIPRPWEIPEREATPETAYLDRRRILRALGAGALGLGLGSILEPRAARGEEPADGGRTRPALGERYAELFPAARNERFGLGVRSLTPERAAASYNNFYEITKVQKDVWERAQGYPVEPWTVEVGGLVARPVRLGLEDLFRLFPLEERLYRFRCVERWAMQVPWTGFPLAKLIDRLRPLASARYVRFVSFHDPVRLPGQRQTWYPWPYYEVLRLDEARNELAFAAVGIYGHALPMQHGAPWRLVVPWKYGYKSAKSIVRIDFLRDEHATFWNSLQPEEYGFYSNVDPAKPHPRWPQDTEWDLATKELRPTLVYNGYGEQVGGLYDGTEV